MNGDFYFASSGDIQLHGYRWEPESQPKAIVQIIHGLGADCLVFLFSHSDASFPASLGLDVLGVLAAEGAILVHLKLFGGVFLVLVGVVVPLLALTAPKGNLDACTCFSHISAPPF